ncbi:MAG: hypothetical protein KIB00_00440 [Paeniclostridium sordellii]|nr:hypothetical protein [Paeniclostridium sordellii]
MSKEKISLNFHETFPPTIRYISEIVQLAANNFEGTKETISEETGIPTGEATGKVVPHIKYAKLMGLIENDQPNGSKYSLQLTPLGRLIYLEDRYFMDKISRSLINYFLCDEEDGAPHWSFIFNHFNYILDSEYALSTIEEQAKLYFGKNVKMTVVKSMYTNDYGFEDLRIMSETSNKNILFERGFIQQDAYYVYAYTLLRSWEKYFRDKIELSIDEIEKIIKWNNKFGFDYNTMLEVFDELENMGLIKINKQLSPVTIIKTSSSDEIMGNMYDLAL